MSFYRLCFIEYVLLLGQGFLRWEDFSSTKSTITSGHRLFVNCFIPLWNGYLLYHYSEIFDTLLTALYRDGTNLSSKQQCTFHPNLANFKQSVLSSYLTDVYKVLDRIFLKFRFLSSYNEYIFNSKLHLSLCKLPVYMRIFCLLFNIDTCVLPIELLDNFIYWKY